MRSCLRLPHVHDHDQAEFRHCGLHAPGTRTANQGCCIHSVSTIRRRTSLRASCGELQRHACFQIEEPVAMLARAKSERTDRQHFTVQSMLLMASFLPASGLCGRLMLPMCAHCEPVQVAVCERRCTHAYRRTCRAITASSVCTRIDCVSAFSGVPSQASLLAA